MKDIKENELQKISGGDSYITGPVLNGVVTIMKLIRDAGYDLGSGIRRMSEDEVCPLK